MLRVLYNDVLSLLPLLSITIAETVPIHYYPFNTLHPTNHPTYKHIHINPYTHHNSHKHPHTPPPNQPLHSQLQLILLDLIKFLIRNKLPRHNLIDRGRGCASLIAYLIVTSSNFYKDDFGRVCFEYFVQ